MKMNDFPSYISSFFTSFLREQKGVSPNTIHAYADAFLLLFQYYSSLGIPEKKISFLVLTKQNIEGFLSWLESERKNKAATRNQRLAAIHSFCKYVIYKDPQYYKICTDLLSIPMKNMEAEPVSYLTLEEMGQLLNTPDSSTCKGIRDLAILVLLYNSGCRVEEFTKIKTGDMNFQAMTVSVVGKGRKHRIIPLNKPTMNIIQKYMKVYSIHAEETERLLFSNNKGEMLTRPGITYIIQKYVDKCRGENPLFLQCSVTPHTFRHSVATHFLEQGVPLIYIRDFLGHESIQTTERYARTNTALLKKSIEQNAEKIRIDVKQHTVTSNELSALLRKITNK